MQHTKEVIYKKKKANPTWKIYFNHKFTIIWRKKKCLEEEEVEERDHSKVWYEKYEIQL